MFGARIKIIWEKQLVDPLARLFTVSLRNIEFWQKTFNVDSKKSIVEVGVEVDGFELNVFWLNSKLELIKLQVEHTKLSTLQPAILFTICNCTIILSTG